MSSNVTIGHDVEMFLYEHSSGNIRSAIGRIGGTKDAPLPVPGSKVGLHVQEDGVTVEINSKPLVVSGGAKFHGTWTKHIRTALSELKTFVNAKTSGDCALNYPSDGHFFSAQDLSNPKATTFGCDPDFLAHEYGKERVPPSAEQMGDLRCAGGHIHIGYDTSKIPPHAMIQLIEAYVYYPRLPQDHQRYRRQYYGLPGLYRPKPYGVEYRTPGNFWLATTKEDFPALVGRFAKALMLMSKQEAVDLWQGVEWARVKSDITRGKADPNYSLSLMDKANTIILASEGVKLDEQEILLDELDPGDARHIEEPEEPEEEDGDEENF